MNCLISETSRGMVGVYFGRDMTFGGYGSDGSLNWTDFLTGGIVWER